ncbi:phosphoribosylformylglycinamidine synthase [Myxococcota bacterium]|nr:phosphoribosylformylglycinamidine synthase [Myxococcota bacterium]MBU1509276.1 phosphoribosylformylglycinamidine synthase [Myxococcota bacterium]
MILRIEAGPQPHRLDPMGRKAFSTVAAELPGHIDDIRVVRVYTVSEDLPGEILTVWANSALSDPIMDQVSVNGHLPTDADWIVEVDFKPGVTDNEGRTARESLGLLMGEEPVPAVYSGLQYRIFGHLERNQVHRIAENFFANTLIQRIRIASRAEFQGGQMLRANPPVVRLSHEPRVRTVSLEGDDAALEQLSRQNVWALSASEMKVVRAWFEKPEVLESRRRAGLDTALTDVEMECIAQSWSEHCKHKIFSANIHYTENGKTEHIPGLYKSCIQSTTRTIRERDGENDRCLSVFVDNAGVVRFDEKHGLVFKVETHNSPSALDPYGGALTGIVGVNRDPFGTGMGAELLFNTDVFCLADPRRDEPPPTGLLHPMRILEGVRTGVEHGGNQSGIPTVNGSVVFDDRYIGKPLVYCGTGGMLPLEINGRPGYRKYVNSGDLVVMVGGRIGMDGIHGATFSSVELSEESPSSAVQIGDPITQKRMFDFLLKARDADLYSGLTDNGAGGLSSSVGEMATFSGGADIDLALAPLKYPGLDPWEILVSESQERMTVAVPPEKLDAFMALSRLMNVESRVLGTFTDTGTFTVRHREKVVALLDLEFLHNGLPRMELSATWTPPKAVEPDLGAAPSLQDSLLRMLSRLNIASKEYWVRQYDHEVKGRTVIKPLCGVKGQGPSDASVMRPFFESMRGIVISHGLQPRYSDIDAGAMAAASVDEAVRNAVAAGGDPDTFSALDNFCWPDPIAPAPDHERKLAALVRANRMLAETCLIYNLPLISGKDSMKNDARVGNRWISVPPTLLVSLVGIVPDVRRAVTMDFKRAGHLVYALGTTRRELGGSEYLAELGQSSTQVPVVHAQDNIMLYRALFSAIQAGLVASCHDLSDGGLGVSLAECAMAGELGCSVDLAQVPVDTPDLRDDELMYSESAGRFIVGVAPEHAAAFEKLLHGLPATRIGEVISPAVLEIRASRGQTVSWNVRDCFTAWHAPLAFHQGKE